MGLNIPGIMSTRLDGATRNTGERAKANDGLKEDFFSTYSASSLTPNLLYLRPRGTGSKTRHPYFRMGVHSLPASQPLRVSPGVQGRVRKGMVSDKGTFHLAAGVSSTLEVTPMGPGKKGH